MPTRASRKSSSRSSARRSSIVTRLAAIPGVATVEPRIVRDVIVDWPSALLPVSARVVSLTHAGDEPLARLHLAAAPRPGRTIRTAPSSMKPLPRRTTRRPAARSASFSMAACRAFQITGVALSSEYVYAVKPGVPIPDDRFFAVLWVDRSAAEAAFDMKGAFNDLVVSLAPGADAKPVIAELDRLLDPYGSVGAIERRDQPSNRFLEDELNQQKTMSITIPIIFFGVAAFLLNAALGRQVAAQREQIAALKALGFPTAPLVLHYLKLVAVIVLLGSAFGVAGGIAFGHAMIASYQGFFRLPDAHLHADAVVGDRRYGDQLRRGVPGRGDRAPQGREPRARRRHAASGAAAFPPLMAGKPVAGAAADTAPHDGAAQCHRPSAARAPDNLGDLLRRADGRARPVLARCHRSDDRDPVQPG